MSHEMKLESEKYWQATRRFDEQRVRKLKRRQWRERIVLVAFFTTVFAFGFLWISGFNTLDWLPVLGGSGR